MIDLWATKRNTGEWKPSEDRNFKEVVELAFISGNFRFGHNGTKTSLGAGT